MQFTPVAAEQSSIEWQRYHLKLEDGGPVYAETRPGHLIVEPWNAFSSLFLIIPVVYWALRLKGRYREFPFLTYCIPLLFMGGLGSTLFHAFRASPLFLYMDILPTGLLTLSLGVYFWKKVLGEWGLTLGIVFTSFMCRLWIFSLFPSHTAINLSYAVTGMVIFVPLLYLLCRTGFRGGELIFVASLFFGFALWFREMDAWESQLLPMGTHFLWHIFSAVGALYLADYLYILDLHAKPVNPRRKQDKTMV